MTIELMAPAKLNLVLEITGHRADGYHEISSVMHTIDLVDRVRLSDATDLRLVVGGDSRGEVPEEGAQNLAFAAARALAEAAGFLGRGARIALEKQIPAGMGLGGGSSDAAAVLRGLNLLWKLDYSEARLCEVAAGIGSDVPFFIVAGACLVTGRGESVEALPEGPDTALTLFVPDVQIEDKTRRMYARITTADHSDGRRARDLAQRLRHGLTFGPPDLMNAFDHHVGEAAPVVAEAMSVCREAGLAVLACGSGPAFFAPIPSRTLTEQFVLRMRDDFNVQTIAARTIGRADALLVREA